MKVIFLDIDGVLNTQDFMNSNYCVRRLEAKKKGLKFQDDLNSKTRDEYGHLFDPRACNWLEYIIGKTDAKIVISSTWRYAGVKGMQDLWKYRDLSGEVIDITPHLTGWRGVEIKAWLDKNEVDSFCIIDDDNDMLDSQIDNFVLVNGKFGLSLKDANRAIEILNKHEQIVP